MKEEAAEFLEMTRIRDLVKKYSQFINFNIYLWDSKVVMNSKLETVRFSWHVGFKFIGN